VKGRKTHEANWVMEEEKGRKVFRTLLAQDKNKTTKRVLKYKNYQDLSTINELICINSVSFCMHL
jgi:hypothetical protein